MQILDYFQDLGAIQTHNPYISGGYALPVELYQAPGSKVVGSVVCNTL